MHVLITGGAGFIGANFIQYWRTHHPDDSITNLDALTYAGNLDNVRSLTGDAQYRFVHGSIIDAACVDGLVAEADIVIHFAAESHVDRSIHDAGVFVQTNVYGTYVVLEAIRRHRKRLHHVSTDEVFGSLALGSPVRFNEITLYNPRSPYAASKAAADHLVRSYITTHGIDATISNCSNNFGPYQFPEKLIPVAIINILLGKPVPVYGDGKYVRDWLYVEDHCRAIDLILQRGKCGETYCIGGLRDDIDNLTLLKKIIAYMGVDDSVLAFVQDRPGHDRRYAVDWSKAHQELGYEPVHDIDTALRATIEWYQKNEWWWHRVISGAYREVP